MDDLPFERDMTFLDSFHVEAHGGDRAFRVENQTGIPKAISGDLLYSKLPALACIASASFRAPNV